MDSLHASFRNSLDAVHSVQVNLAMQRFMTVTVSVSAGHDSNTITPCSVKNSGPSHEFFLRYGFVVRSGSELNCQVIRNFYWQSVSRDDVDMARILLELLFVRPGNFRLSNFDVHSLIVALCTE